MPNRVHRLTCAIRRDRSNGVTPLLSEMGISSVLVESGRSVRRRRYARRFGFGAYRERLDSSPTDIYRFSVSPSLSEPVIRRVATALQMDQPGRGTIFAQEGDAFLNPPEDSAPPLPEANPPLPGLLRELAVITCVMSMSGSGQDLAKVALELGTGVPAITLGRGTGMRDRLGLLRITVPAEKEVVRLSVPALDAEGVIRMLIEKGNLNRPGKGFIYCAPVLHGILDTSLLVGPQEHAATLEQVIAAIDQLTEGTAWRRRFPELDPEAVFSLRSKCSEITIVCDEEQETPYVEAAMQAGAGGATTASLHRMKLGETGGKVCERCVFVVSEASSGRVVQALLEAQGEADSPLEMLETRPVTYAFSHSP